MFSESWVQLSVARLSFVAIACAACGAGCLQAHDITDGDDAGLGASMAAEATVAAREDAQISEMAETERDRADGSAEGPREVMERPGTRTESEGSGSVTADMVAAGQGAALTLNIPADCEELATGAVPETLRCTGLYADVATKELDPALRSFAPAYRLWSDGADKTRWIYLPPDTTIDNSDADDWKLPVGTKLFKEFVWDGQRVETRMFHKAAEGRWVKATYRWNGDETAATRHPGGVVDVNGYAYTIPSGTECDDCHKGRRDRALGFEQLLLSLPGAEGVTLADLVAEGRLSDPPENPMGQLGDDGSGQAAEALGYLHANCGVCCHNDNFAADAFSTGMFLRLPAAAADGRSFAELDPWKTTMGQEAMTPRWDGSVRIAPGQPEQSLVLRLMGLRDPENPKDRMPPIGSFVVDEAGVELVSQWIESLSQ